jgi:N-acetyl-1-D-myo-inositol-2-amino-2-deoxy-alpha-D-glucopyranoside deacetylase
LEARSLVFVGAHPDDESFGLGGTLAYYAARGVRVYYACATRGEVGAADPEHLAGHASPGDMRWAELMCAARELGLADVMHLGYRDSGMPGSPDNEHPDALVAAPLDEVTERVTAVLRAVRPQVVITFDPIGGYRHPDHIAIHKATVEAFHAAGDPARFPQAGPPYQPQKLYYSVFPRGALRAAVRVLPLLRRDPRRFGRNGDIDLVSLAEVEFPAHVRIDIRGEALRRSEAASACHKSQLSGGPGPGGRNVLSLVMRLMRRRDAYMRAYPPVADGRVHESDLFDGVKL